MNKELSYYTKDERNKIVEKYNKDGSNFMDTLKRVKNNVVIPLKYNLQDPQDLAKINVDDPNINWDHILNKKASDYCDLHCEKECKTKKCQDDCPRVCRMTQINQMEQLIWDSKPRVKSPGRVGFAGGRPRPKSKKRSVSLINTRYFKSKNGDSKKIMVYVTPSGQKVRKTVNISLLKRKSSKRKSNKRKSSKRKTGKRH
jgi:hypothetical protein